MNRRGFLLSIGAASVGTGAVFGSGAFTSIEADRNVNLQVTGDTGSAQVGFSPGSGATSIVGTDTNESVDIINFEQTNLNEQAKTSFENALEVDNNSQSKVNLYIDDSTTGVGDDPTNGEVLDFREGSAGVSIVGSDQAIALDPDGGSSDGGYSDTVELDIVVDLRDDGVDGDDLSEISDVTFVVEAVQQ
ncbi:hypothetical protein [Haloarcula sp. CGMCC 1.6347]|uniref:hypothetical protein n=1 Tax=Haloarcula sp. CGMCC 1.6347 TaxID=3111455 RepID=UPI000677FD84